MWKRVDLQAIVLVQAEYFDFHLAAKLPSSCINGLWKKSQNSIYLALLELQGLPSLNRGPSVPKGS